MPVVVNQSFAQRLFSSGDPIGRHFGAGKIAGDNFEIVGLVSDVKYRSLRETPTAMCFTLAQDTDFLLYVNTLHDPEQLVKSVRDVLTRSDSTIPLVEVHTLSAELDANSAPERLAASVAALLATISASICGVGVYSLFAYALAYRKVDVGIRIALGATPFGIAMMIGRQAGAITLADLLIGVGTCFVTGHLIRPCFMALGPKTPRRFLERSYLWFLWCVLVLYLPQFAQRESPPVSQCVYESERE